MNLFVFCDCAVTLLNAIVAIIENSRFVGSLSPRLNDFMRGRQLSDSLASASLFASNSRTDCSLNSRKLAQRSPVLILL